MPGEFTPFEGPGLALLLALLFILGSLATFKLWYMKHRRIHSIHHPPAAARRAADETLPYYWSDATSVYSHVTRVSQQSASAPFELAPSPAHSRRTSFVEFSVRHDVGEKGGEDKKQRRSGYFVGMLGSPDWEIRIVTTVDDTRTRESVVAHARACDRGAVLQRVHELPLRRLGTMSRRWTVHNPRSIFTPPLNAITSFAGLDRSLSPSTRTPRNSAPRKPRHAISLSDGSPLPHSSRPRQPAGSGAADFSMYGLGIKTNASVASSAFDSAGARFSFPPRHSAPLAALRFNTLSSTASSDTRVSGTPCPRTRTSPAVSLASSASSALVPRRTLALPDAPPPMRNRGHARGSSLPTLGRIRIASTAEHAPVRAGLVARARRRTPSIAQGDFEGLGESHGDGCEGPHVPSTLMGPVRERRVRARRSMSVSAVQGGPAGSISSISTALAPASAPAPAPAPAPPPMIHVISPSPAKKRASMRTEPSSQLLSPTTLRPVALVQDKVASEAMKPSIQRSSSVKKDAPASPARAALAPVTRPLNVSPRMSPSPSFGQTFATSTPPRHSGAPAFEGARVRSPASFHSSTSSVRSPRRSRGSVSSAESDVISLGSAGARVAGRGGAAMEGDGDSDSVDNSSDAPDDSMASWGDDDGVGAVYADLFSYWHQGSIEPDNIPASPSSA